MKRTPQNCTVADRVYSRDGHDRYVGDKCAGVRIAVGWDGDEPIDMPIRGLVPTEKGG